jgi:hypothetical protein
MAKIQVVTEHCTATLTEPDEEGFRGWEATCGRTSHVAFSALSDVLEHAEVHVDIRCPMIERD